MMMMMMIMMMVVVVLPWLRWWFVIGGRLIEDGEARLSHSGCSQVCREEGGVVVCTMTGGNKIGQWWSL